MARLVKFCLQFLELSFTALFLNFIDLESRSTGWNRKFLLLASGITRSSMVLQNVLKTFFRRLLFQYLLALLLAVVYQLGPVDFGSLRWLTKLRFLVFWQSRLRCDELDLFGLLWVLILGFDEPYSVSLDFLDLQGSWLSRFGRRVENREWFFLKLKGGLRIVVLSRSIQCLVCLQLVESGRCSEFEKHFAPSWGLWRCLVGYSCQRFFAGKLYLLLA